MPPSSTTTSQISNIDSLPYTRRIVTGNDENDKSQILYDDTKGDIKIIGDSASMFQTLWFTNDVPVDCSSETSKDPTGNKTFQISNSGTVCTVVWLRPGSITPMHQTKSIDYGVVLEGEIVLQLDSGVERLMKPGDVVVQRATTHAWHNRHPTKWAKVLFILVATRDAVSKSKPASD